MTITHAEIRHVLSQYLDRYPGEVSDMALLFHALNEGHEVTSRAEFRTGDVTAGAVVLNNEERVLLIRHKTLDTWLLPGGHLEPEDTHLLGASLRELEEETGILRQQIVSSSAESVVPLDINIHRIPTNPAKEEPEHHHFDFRYAHRIEDTSVHLQLDEVTDFAWQPIIGPPDRTPGGETSFLDHAKHLTLGHQPGVSGKRGISRGDGYGIAGIGSAMTGSWSERTSPTGYYRGSVYRGALQLLLDPMGKIMRGKWFGFDREANVDSNVWELHWVREDTEKTVQREYHFKV